MGAGAGTRSTPRAGGVPVKVRIDEVVTPALFELDVLGSSLHHGVFKDSYPDYPREAAADAPA